MEQCKTIYGNWFLSYNVHCLIHLADYVMRFGALCRYSSFIFENNMKTVKAMVRKHECVLAQIVRRMYEQETNLIKKIETGKTVLKSKHSSEPVFSTGVGKQFKEIHYKSMINKCDVANSCVILEDETVVKILNIIEHNNTVVIIGQKLNNLRQTDLFQKPLRSSRLGIFSVNTSRMSFQNSWPISAIKCKAVCIPYSSKKDFAIFPLMRIEN